MFGGLNLRGRGYKSRLLSIRDELWDRRLGIRTFDYEPGRGEEGQPDWQVDYVPTPYPDLIDLLKCVGLTTDDIFVDLGCGLGRAVFLASWMGAKRSIGLEVIPRLYDLAVANLKDSALAQRDIEFLCMNAREFRDEKASVLFMFHPFGEDTLRQVLENIEEKRRGVEALPLRIIYLNPVCNHVLEKAKWLRLIGRSRTPKRPLSYSAQYDVTFWTSTGRS